MPIIYLLTLFFSFTMSFVPALQHLLDPVFVMIGVGGGFKTPFVDMLIIAGMIIILVNSKGSGVKKNFINIFKWWAPWVLYLLIRSNFSELGLWKFEMYIAKLLIPTMAITLVCIAIPDKFEKYFFSLLIMLAIILIPSMYLYDFGEKDFYNNIWLSRMLAICGLYLFINLTFNLKMIVKLTLISVFFITMILIGSRGPVLSFILSAGVYFMVKNRNNIKIMIAGGVFALVLGIIVIQLSSISISSNVASFLTHGKSDKIENVEKADDRSGIYPGTIAVIADNPVFGVGLAMWFKHYYNYIGKNVGSDYLYPHNFLLEVLSELGLIGLVLFLFLFKPYKRIFCLNNQYNIFILLGLLFASTSSDITQNSTPFIFSLLSFIYFKRKLSSSVNEKTDSIVIETLQDSTKSKYQYQSVKLRS